MLGKEVGRVTQLCIRFSLEIRKCRNEREVTGLIFPSRTYLFPPLAELSQSSGEANNRRWT